MQIDAHLQYQLHWSFQLKVPFQALHFINLLNYNLGTIYKKKYKLEFLHHFLQFYNNNKRKIYCTPNAELLHTIWNFYIFYIIFKTRSLIMQLRWIINWNYFHVNTKKFLTFRNEAKLFNVVGIFLKLWISHFYLHITRDIDIVFVRIICW